MPDLNFRVTGVEPAARGLIPLLHFKLELRNTPATEEIHAVILQAQIHIESAQRQYQDEEKKKLEDLFGTPDRWGQTLRTRLWSHASITVRSFSDMADAILPVQCTYDLNVTATKYFYALEEGEVPLLFLFSGTVFYPGPDGRLQVQRISWERECKYRMPVAVWRALMEHHYPNSAWVSLHRGVFERLYAYKRRHGLPTWEQTIERLLGEPDEA
ncbi:MAG: hypothetical protein JO151_20930 [Verrucomicrobia bacterium]|nr:hypothetical protein [Verrucomicrobiota bacterium]